MFQPLTLGALQLPTRVVMPPTTRTFCPDRVPHAGVVDYYRRRAAAGVGLLITEDTTCPQKAADGYPNV
ncbi:oxidoreductase, partial [Pseudomonas faucium]|uniref:oxidoreductase n=1 Tax=Pseudomonas faucium TaxID=2740518 RepID=UPI003FCDE121